MRLGTQNATGGFEGRLMRVGQTRGLEGKLRAWCRLGLGGQAGGGGLKGRLRAWMTD